VYTHKVRIFDRNRYDSFYRTARSERAAAQDRGDNQGKSNGLARSPFVGRFFVSIDVNGIRESIEVRIQR
jgi:hypothetical protein